MKREVTDYLKDIISYTEKAEELVATTPKEQLTQFSTEGLALMLCLQIIGEAVKNIPAELRGKYPEIPWKQAMGMRDRIAHGYWNTSLIRVAETVIVDLPEFKAAIKKVLNDLSS